MARLIIGGAGFIGAELAHMLVERGEDVVLFVRTVRKERIGDIMDRVKVVPGDVGVFSHVLNVVRDYKINHIYHMSSMLAIESDNNPWSAMQTNVTGMFNVLEAARLFNVEKVMYASSVGAFGDSAQAEVTDISLQRPHEFYGVSKLFGEGLGRFYRRRFGLDFRSIRYPTVTGPGVITPGRHWDARMVEQAFLGIPYECPVSEKETAPLMYYKDAALAADMVLQAPKEKIQMVNYNIAGVTGMMSAKDLEMAIKKHIPGAVITYSKNPMPPSFHCKMKILDDSCARKEWGWKPKFTTLDQTVSAFIEELKTRSRQGTSR